MRTSKDVLGELVGSTERALREPLPEFVNCGDCGKRVEYGNAIYDRDLGVFCSPECYDDARAEAVYDSFERAGQEIVL